MTSPGRRLVLRSVHLIFSIPILGYIYGPIAQVQQYAGAVRYVFVPIIILSGFWMYAGLAFAAFGVALWLAAYWLSGSGAAILCQAVLFIGWKIGRTLRSRSKNKDNAIK